MDEEIAHSSNVSTLSYVTNDCAIRKAECDSRATNRLHLRFIVAHSLLMDCSVKTDFHVLIDSVEVLRMTAAASPSGNFGFGVKKMSAIFSDAIIF